MTQPAESLAPVTPDASAPSVARRRLLYAGVAGAAALGGAGFAWWKFQPHAVEPGGEQALWGLEFETPAGSTVAMKSLAGKPLLLNFWATWCPPCVQELPLLNAFYGEHRAKGWQVLGLAIDQPANVQKFLQRMPLDFPVVLGGLGGAELSRGLGNDKGGLPFTVMFAADGSISKRKIGQLTPQDLQR